MQLLRTFTPQDSTAQRPTHGACSLNKIALMLAVFAIAQWRPGRGLSDDMPLLARVEEQANLFVIPDADAIARFQAELRVELANLEQYLQRGTTAEQQGWKNYLQWDALTANSTGEPDIEFLKTAQLLFRAGHAGLERPAFVGVRDKVDRLLFALSTQSLPDSFRQAFQLRVNQLVNAMREAESDPIFESLHQISTTLNTLESLGFSQELATAVRSQYQLPNLRITADGDFIYNTFAAPVSRTIPVSESLLGTRFRGTAETTGTAKLRLIPSNGTARFELIFDGTTISNARGSQHPVQVGTRAFTSAHAIKLITLDDDGFSSSSSVASCRTTTRV
ncbi:MAG: hypothetical protein KDB27_06065, partial [Planctomycetales bacterium]|nr:hypothetical protein [Planctomycetales bacterium]